MLFADRLVAYALCGVVGGLMHDLLRYRGELSMPRWKPQEGKLRTGTLGSMGIGIVAAAIADGRPEFALTAAIAGPHLLEEGAGWAVEFLRGRRKVA